MIRFRSPGQLTRQVCGIGLTDEDLRKLKKQPLHIALDSMGVTMKDNIDVVVFCGRNHDDLKAQMDGWAGEKEVFE